RRAQRARATVRSSVGTRARSRAPELDRDRAPALSPRLAAGADRRGDRRLPAPPARTDRTCPRVLAAPRGRFVRSRTCTTRRAVGRRAATGGGLCGAGEG